MKTERQQPEIVYTWIAWVCLIAGIVAVSIATGFSHSVCDAYALGAARWMGGTALYTESVHGFLYLPHAAMIYAPFEMLPLWLGESLWRVLMMGGFAYGIYAFSKELEKKYVANLFTITSIVAIPMILDSARNGQMTLLLTGLMLLATRDLLRGRLWWVTLWLMLGLALKPLIFVTVMLIAGVYLKSIWRFAIGILVLFFVPMLFASPSYVMEQYAGFIRNSKIASDPYAIANGQFSDLFGMLRAWGIGANGELQTLIRMAIGAGVWLLCLYGKKIWGHYQGACLILAFSICYLMLFNPRTEINTYSMFSVVLGIYAGWSIILNKQKWLGGAMITIAFLIGGNYEIMRHITPENPHWLPPFLTSIFSIYLIGIILFGQHPIEATQNQEIEEQAEICAS